MTKSGSFLKDVLKNLGFAVLAFIIGFPHLVLARYSIPGADDFSCANAVSIYRENHNAIASALAYTRDVYQSWQGTYTGEFIMGMEPSVRESYTALRVIMVISVILFVTALIFLVHTICTKALKMTSGQGWAVGLLSEFIVFNISLTGELFSWYTGAAVYTFPLIGMLLCLAFSIRSYFDGKLVYAILAGIFGVIGAGGSLQVVGFGCAAYLVALIAYMTGIKNIKANIKRILFLCLPFIFTVAGALVNTAAPGNFKRHDAMEAGGVFEVGMTFTSSWYNMITHIGYMLTAYLVPAVIAAAFLICVCSASKVAVTGKALAASACGAVFIAVVTIFPVILGYGTYDIDSYLSSSRIHYVFDMTITMLFVLLACVAGFYMKELLHRNNISVKEQALKTVLIAVVLVLMFSGEVFKNYQNGMNYKIMDDLKCNRLIVASEQMEALYEKVDAAEDGTDVVIEEPVLPGTVLYIPLYIDYPDYFANHEVANYYHVNSFSVHWIA